MIAIINVSDLGTELVQCEGTSYNEDVEIVIGGLHVNVSWEQLVALHKAIERHFGLPDEDDEGEVRDHDP